MLLIILKIFKEKILKMPTIKPIPRVLDVSHYNVIEGLQEAVKFGIWGIIHKATENTNNVDKKLEARRFLTQQAGLLWGTYHFIRPGNIKKQVDWYLKNAHPKDTDLMVLDWEDNKVSAAATAEWLANIFNITGRKAAIYSGNTAKELIKGKNEFFGSHKLWLAQYGNVPSVQKSWDNPWLWQYTGDGKGQMPHSVPGIAIPGNPGIDINHYAGTKQQLIKEWSGA